MSKREHINDINAFDGWIADEFARSGGFTALVFLVAIGNLSVVPLRSTFLHVIGDDVDWAQFTGLLAGSGVKWDGVLFHPLTDSGGGPVSDEVARQQLAELTTRVTENRLVMNEGHFFDKWGRRMKIEEAQPQ